jgi:hypothetical protein
MAKRHLRLVTPATINRTVRPKRPPNGDLRTREYLTEAEVERLMKVASREEENDMTTEEDVLRKNAEFTRGRPFAKCNPGRPPGSKNRTTIIAQALLEGEAEDLVRKSIELAMGGDVQMLRFLLDRLLPKERSIKIDIPPLEFAEDAIDGMAVNVAIAEGKITPREGAALSNLIAGYSRTIEITEFSQRIEAIENSMNPESKK